MSAIDKLEQIFIRFPGIGKRQARRFVYFLLGADKQQTTDLISALTTLTKNSLHCSECKRFFVDDGRQSDVCSICEDISRDSKLLLVVEKDVDFEAIEESETYKGRYFILGGTLPLLETENASTIRSKELKVFVKKLKPEEIILALSATPEGENTSSKLGALLQKEFPKIKVALLGRGLSTGTELEYSDKETIKNALSTRT